MKKYIFVIFCFVFLVCGCHSAYTMIIPKIDTNDHKLICQYVENLSEYYYKEKIDFDYNSIIVYQREGGKTVIYAYATKKTKKYKVQILIGTDEYFVDYVDITKEE